ncbi:hypothetical protein PQY76_00365 [bacterium]|nr:hypothetical protein [bacterium]MDC6465843.1 hypothetical protein [bacterium]|tara:strand:- start:4785 stop:4907 length:123 start_codon:yes stop_codon:yes gene_type:complete
MAISRIPWEKISHTKRRAEKKKKKKKEKSETDRGHRSIEN